MHERDHSAAPPADRPRRGACCNIAAAVGLRCDQRRARSAQEVALADALVGFVSGGLGIVTVMACMFFSAISGSSVATVSAIGSFMIPEMAKKKYDPGFSAALAALPQVPEHPTT